MPSRHEQGRSYPCSSRIETDIVFIATYCPRLVSPCHSGKTQLGHALSWIELTDGGVCAPGTFIFDSFLDEPTQMRQRSIRGDRFEFERRIRLEHLLLSLYDDLVL